ncbi:MAG: hypothetical protein A2Z20_07135 [Bdellovibrionales bacterium RBG_16_40_8]|nr:MAG: hypothetical protein A2Z20_07135 [Bdellovibrionales bacterium RBG_16_40_8]
MAKIRSRWSISFKLKIQILILCFIVILISAIAASLVFTKYKAELLPESAVTLLRLLDEVNDAKYAMQRQRIEWGEALIMIYKKLDVNDDFDDLYKSASSVSEYLTLLKNKLPDELHEQIEQVITIQNQIKDTTLLTKEKALRKIAVEALRSSSQMDDLFTQAFSLLHKISNRLVEISVSQQYSGIAQINFTFKMLIWALGILGLFVFTGLSMFLGKVSSKIHIITKKALNVASSSRAQSQTLKESSQHLKDSAKDQVASVFNSKSYLSNAVELAQQNTYAVHTSMTSVELGLGKTREGRGLVDKLSQAMKTISESFNDLQRVTKIIKEISEKTQVIHDIVFKTQMLSFNAAIEAERAGEYGRGFAIVAEEVGLLAANSQRAAHEIELLIKNSLSQVNAAVTRVDEVFLTAKDASVDVEKSFQVIAQSMEDINAHIVSIESATVNQEVAVKETNRSVSDIEKTAIDNSNSAQKNVEAIEVLDRENEQLVEISEELSLIVNG